MNDSLIIPDNIQVGFNKREETYTGKLAYVIYRDAKGVLRKEKSWEGWCDKKIPKESYTNDPVSGFVLNKDVGGTRHSYGSWNARVEKVRVYDPRGFEFEIDIPNLLFILQESSSIKGKGLEGDFVYSWSGKNLVLLPIASQEYKESTVFTQLQTESVSAKDMIVGCTYLTKKRENWMYMGKHTWFDTYERWGRNVFAKSVHVFVNMDYVKQPYDKGIRARYELETSFAKIAKQTSTTPHPDYANEFEKLSKTSFISVPVKLETIPLTDKGENFLYYGYQDIIIPHNNVLYIGNAAPINSNYYYDYRHRNKKDMLFNVICNQVARLTKNGHFERVNCEKLGVQPYIKNNMRYEEVNAIGKDLVVVCENDVKYKIKE